MSADPIVSREVIAAQAEQDAIHMITQGLEEMPNRYPPDTAAAIVWKVSFQRFLLKHSAPEDVEGGA